MNKILRDIPSFNQRKLFNFEMFYSILENDDCNFLKELTKNERNNIENSVKSLLNYADTSFQERCLRKIENLKSDFTFNKLNEKKKKLLMSLILICSIYYDRTLDFSKAVQESVR